jgi:glutamate/tyrosine decarboxylase-like PLP-dependent enzyme
MDANCQLAQTLAARIEAHPDLVLRAPVALNIVCFGFARRGAEDGALNRRIVERLHAAGRVAPSITLLDGVPAIRAALVNHRTTLRDVDALIEGVLAFGHADRI